jgi:signal transduction histidine kinase
MSASAKIIFLSVILGLSSWFVEAAFHYHVLREGPFIEVLISRLTFHEFYNRSIMLALFLLFGLVAMRQQEVKEKIEIKVAERTRDLNDFNAKLKTELKKWRETVECVEEFEKRLHLLSFGILNAQETERKRISAELHDELGQALVIVKLRLCMMKKRVNEDQVELRQECQENLHAIDQMIENVRRISQNLSPHILEYFGLTLAMRRLIDDFVKHYALSLTADLIDVDQFFSQDAQLAIYRILQETLNNIGKHAQASRLSVKMEKQGDFVSFMVEDDGKGFDIIQTMLGDSVGKKLGMAVMAERLRMLGGTREVVSRIGSGTRITFIIAIQRTKGNDGMMCKANAKRFS